MRKTLTITTATLLATLAACGSADTNSNADRQATFVWAPRIYDNVAQAALRESEVGLLRSENEMEDQEVAHCVLNLADVLIGVPNATVDQVCIEEFGIDLLDYAALTVADVTQLGEWSDDAIARYIARRGERSDLYVDASDAD